MSNKEVIINRESFIEEKVDNKPKSRFNLDLMIAMINYLTIGILVISLVVLMKKISQLSCISITNKAWMYIAIIFILLLANKFYWEKI